ncbi:MAG: septal ring lytic transglycosylase RlpA family lipoprotein [Salinivirgaceae bacterium]|nr:MAG: septal ring lytic transglycosylase RlpA family lipoprotein [Salinivirgaceae bacterium]
MKRIILLIISVLVPFIMLSQKQIEYGKASFYANKFEGRTTASGEKYWHSKLTAAHRTLPFNTRVRVTNLEKNLSVIVRINDRGPFVKDRIIDLSKSAAKKLEFVKDGVCDVKIEVLESPDAGNSSTSQNVTAPIIAKPRENSSASSAPVGPSFYTINVNSEKPLGYGVQLASYKEMVNLLERVQKIQTTLKEPITVQVSSVNGEKVYRIIAGKFDNRIKAERYKEDIRDNFPGCFIFKF